MLQWIINKLFPKRIEQMEDELLKELEEDAWEDRRRSIMAKITAINEGRLDPDTTYIGELSQDFVEFKKYLLPSIAETKYSNYPPCYKGNKPR